jgi:hypothetical protein
LSDRLRPGVEPGESFVGATIRLFFTRNVGSTQAMTSCASGNARHSF